jgi:hypothetical protein
MHRFPSPQDYRVAMFEKLIWISSFMLVGALRGGCTVGTVVGEHKKQASSSK